MSDLLKKAATTTFEAMKLSSKGVFENKYRNGVGAALLMCTSPLMDYMKTNRDIVQSQPECPEFMTKYFDLYG
jgi:hypothetical protein